MGKMCKVIVCGQNGTGKTAILEQLIYNNHVVGSPTFSTLEDIYAASITIDVNRNLKEVVHFFDSAGVEQQKPEIPKHYLSFADGFVLVYDVTNQTSFQCMDKLKKEIEKHKEKKDAIILILGNKCDLKDARTVDFHTANQWAQKEKVRLWEVSVMNRQSLIEPFTWITTKITSPQTKSSFPSLLGQRRGPKVSDI